MADAIDHAHITEDNNDLIDQNHHEESSSSTSSSSKSIITFKLHPDSIHSRFFMTQSNIMVFHYNSPLVGPAVEIGEEEIVSRSDEAYSKFREMLCLVEIASSYRDRLIRYGIKKARELILSGRKKEPAEEFSEIKCKLRFYTKHMVELRGEETGMVPASNSAIEALEVGKLRDIVKQDGSEEFLCSICLEEEKELEAESLVTRMPCKHVFHSKCITQWLKISHYCPMCRFVLA
ncbi:hypothetical protein ACOSQ2_003631 [Xanthoceras sorbifolium]